VTASHDAPHRGGATQTGEAPQEQLTRNFDELLQELRVTQTGVQILTGFLLTLPFTDRFQDLDDTTSSATSTWRCCAGRSWRPD
jgi:hypothetical protein